MHSTAYIAIGSNLGDRSRNISDAIACIGAHASIEVGSQSRLYEFSAMAADDRPQPDYLNGVVEIRTSLEPLALLDTLQAIECQLGRAERHGRWEPRTIDLDILLYDARIIETPRLIVPHPEMPKRMFVLQPLCDIAPHLEHPVERKTIRELLRAIS
jgi:2-amino-4-hydroxy-6-hydroxymethyldihydropteridine diphosphokinase